MSTDGQTTMSTSAYHNTTIKFSKIPTKFGSNWSSRFRERDLLKCTSLSPNQTQRYGSGELNTIVILILIRNNI
jgi:hypothetical protein